MLDQAVLMPWAVADFVSLSSSPSSSAFLYNTISLLVTCSSSGIGVEKWGEATRMLEI